MREEEEKMIAGLFHAFGQKCVQCGSVAYYVDNRFYCGVCRKLMNTPVADRKRRKDVK